MYKFEKKIGKMDDGTPLTVEVESMFPPEEHDDAIIASEISGAGKLRRSPVQSRSITRLDQIDAAARIVYNRAGRDRLTTKMVANEAGISIGTVYRYFVDRVALLDYIAPDRDKSPIAEDRS